MKKFMKCAAVIVSVLCAAALVASLFMGIPGYVFLAVVGVLLFVLPALAALLYVRLEEISTTEEKHHQDRLTQTVGESPQQEHDRIVSIEKSTSRMYGRPFDPEACSKEVWRRIQDANPQEKQIVVDIKVNQQTKGKQ